MQQPSIVEFVAPQAREQGIQQGIQQGAQETTRKFILVTLAFRLEPEVVQTFKPILDAIDDLQHLEQLFNAAMQVETPEDFTKALYDNNDRTYAIILDIGSPTD